MLKLQYFGHLMWRANFIRKGADAGKCWRQKEKGTTEDDIRLNGHEFEQAPGDGEGQGSLACCSPRGHRVRQDWAPQHRHNHPWHKIRHFQSNSPSKCVNLPILHSSCYHNPNQVIRVAYRDYTHSCLTHGLAAPIQSRTHPPLDNSENLQWLPIVEQKRQTPNYLSNFVTHTL